MKYPCFFIKVERTQEKAKQVCLSMFREDKQLWIDTLNDNNKGIQKSLKDLAKTSEKNLHWDNIDSKLK